MVVTVAAPFEARGGRVAEEGKCPGPGRQARGGGDIGTCSLRPDPGGHQTTEETDPRASPEGWARGGRACGVGDFPCAAGWSRGRGESPRPDPRARRPRMCFLSDCSFSRGSQSSQCFLSIPPAPTGLP